MQLSVYENGKKHLEQNASDENKTFYRDYDRVQDSTFGMLLSFPRIPVTETTREAVKAS